MRSRKRRKLPAVNSRKNGISAFTSRMRALECGKLQSRRQEFCSLDLQEMQSRRQAGNVMLFLKFLEKRKTCSGSLPLYLFYSFHVRPCLQAVPRCFRAQQGLWAQLIRAAMKTSKTRRPATWNWKMRWTAR